MSFKFGNNIKVTLRGGSHERAVGVLIEGLPAGVIIDEAFVADYLRRRAPGQGGGASERKENDCPHVLSGLEDGVTTGEALDAEFLNEDACPADYEALSTVPRPSHGDYPAWVKAGSKGAIPSGGATSARMTVGLVYAGAICMQLLNACGINIDAFAKISEDGYRFGGDDDSYGGQISCKITGLPVGLGESYFDGLESRLSSAMFAIPAVKGIEFGLGFAAADMLGSEYNDAFYFDADGKVKTKTNHCGGILGGMANGMPVTFNLVFKPTPSIGLEQDSVDLQTGRNVKLTISGRHDQCVVPRAVPIVECVSALVIYDMMKGEGRI